MDNIINNENYARVTEILLKFGIKPKMIGFEYLRYAVIMQYQNNKRKLMDIYEEIGKIYNTKPYSVEKGIRNAINYAYSIGGLLSVNDYYDMVVYNNGERYTNLELISVICEILKLDRLKNRFNTEPTPIKNQA